jgi:hypothetical protein
MQFLAGRYLGSARLLTSITISIGVQDALEIKNVGVRRARRYWEAGMEIDLPEIVAEVKAEFERYENALVSNDVATLGTIFRDDARTIRYGGAEILYGYKDIQAFRAARAPVGLTRTLSRTVITTYGRDYAVASTLFHRPSAPGKVGRQMQTWVRFAAGWRIVAAHVSVIDE